MNAFALTIPFLLALAAPGPSVDSPGLSSAVTWRPEAILAWGDPLPGGSSFPWYDAKKDELRRLNVQPPPDFANRHSRWRPGVPSGWSIPAWFWRLLEVIGWMVVVALIVLVCVLLVRAFLARELANLASGDGEASADAGDRSDAARIEQLPFSLAAGRTDLLAEARRCYEAGDYNRAIIYLYSYFLVQLDRRHLIRLTKGKTNRQYLREVRSQGRLHVILQTTMLAFEDVFFGGHPLDAGRFEACWRAVPDFQQQLEEVAA